MADGSKALVAARAARRGQRWEVEFARFFAMPQRGPSSPPPPGLRHLPPGKLRRPGTWLPAAAPASLTVSRPHTAASAVLSVSIGDVLFEEHFVSILNISWPQVTCVTQCPIRGSRVVFMSFCDKSRQIQKFAVRFPELSDAESFLNFVKQCSGETMDIIPSGSDYVCKDSSASEYIASNGLHHRPDEGSSFQEPASDHRTGVPALGYNEEPDQCAPEPLLANNIENIFSSFPPSFTEMLTNFSNGSERDAEEPYTGTDNSHEVVHTMDSSHDGIADKETVDGKESGKETGAVEETGKEPGDVMARIEKYMADNSFHDMLFKLERVIDELGGDLSL